MKHDFETETTPQLITRLAKITVEYHRLLQFGTDTPGDHVSLLKSEIGELQTELMKRNREQSSA